MEKFSSSTTSDSLSTILDTLLAENELPNDLGDKWKSSYVNANASCDLDPAKRNSFISMQEHKVKISFPLQHQM